MPVDPHSPGVGASIRTRVRARDHRLEGITTEEPASATRRVYQAENYLGNQQRKKIFFKRRIQG